MARCSDCSGWLQTVMSLMVLILVVCLYPAVTQAQTQKKTVLRVAGYLMSPYLMEQSNKTENDTSNDQYTGFIKELLDVLTKEMDVDYELYLADGYGSLASDGHWTGMVGEVVKQKANMTAGPLTVTSDREKVVDFTNPFQRFEATIVMLKRHWNQEPHIESLEDLVNQDQVIYGVATGGPVYNFLKESKAELHEKMWAKMNEDPVVHFKDDNNKGVRRARKDSNYAFILNGASADYVVGQEPCDLQAIKAGFYQRQYAFAVGNQDALRDDINEALVELEFNGVLDELRAEWLAPDRCVSGADCLQQTLSFIVMTVVVTIYSALLVW